jgi:hypothetical protein
MEYLRKLSRTIGHYIEDWNTYGCIFIGNYVIDRNGNFEKVDAKN